MRHALLLFLILTSTTAVFAQDHADTAATQAPSRSALLKAAVARDRGDITAMEPSSGDGQGVVIGYSSGAILRCYGKGACKEFGGTPGTAVQHIAISAQGKTEVIWASYRQGALYQCIDKLCTSFVWDGVQSE